MLYQTEPQGDAKDKPVFTWLYYYMDPFRIKIIQPLSKTYSSSTHYKILLLLTQIHAEKNNLLTFGRN